MNLFSRLREKLVSVRLESDLRAGRKLRGRQPNVAGGSPGIKAQAEPFATMTARVWRESTQTWEDVT